MYWRKLCPQYKRHIYKRLMWHLFLQSFNGSVPFGQVLLSVNSYDKSYVTHIALFFSFWHLESNGRGYLYTAVLWPYYFFVWNCATSVLRASNSLPRKPLNSMQALSSLFANENMWLRKVRCLCKINRIKQVLGRETEKCGHKSSRTQNQEGLWWRNQQNLTCRI